MKNHTISKKKTLIEALTIINSLAPNPLVLFVLDENKRIVGTLTDGDARRALIAGVSVNDTVEKVMHRSFNYIKVEDINDVKKIKQQKEMKMKLVPVLDNEMHIVEIINLEKYATRLPIDAVLMAGGKGERLRPLTEKTPKPLLPVGGKAIIDYNIDRLIDCGIKHINVTVNYLGEQLEEHFSKPRGEVKVQTVREPQFLGTIGSVRFVKKFFHDSVLIMNSDLFTNINYEDFYLHFKEHEADMAAVAVPYSITVPYGIFDISGERNIVGLQEKPTYNYLANAGIYLIKRQMIEQYIPENSFYNATDFMERLIAEGRKVIRFPLSGYWIDIGNKQEYAKAQDLAKHL